MFVSFTRGCLLAVALVGSTGAPFVALGQSIEAVPPSLASTNGGSGNLIPIGAAGGGTYQVLYPASQLVGLPLGCRINSIRLRQRNLEIAAWPPAAATIGSYEVRIGGTTKTPTTLSTTFAANIIDPVLVRSGALNLATGTYPGSGASGSIPEGWGPEIVFDTPYTYTGGPLVFEFRNNGNGAPQTFADASNNSSLGSAVGNTSSSSATLGSLTSIAIVMQLGVSPANARTVTLPNANDAVAGPSGNSIPLGAYNNGRMLALYAADQLASVPPGSVITGMQLRLRNAESSGWPAADSTNAEYVITLSQSTLTPGTISTTFATNQLNPVVVRSGSYFLPANIYPAGANSGSIPEPWGPVIPFSTPFVYQGGALSIDIRSLGGIAPVKFCDVVPASGTAAGISAEPRTATTGGTSSVFVSRLTFVPPVESPFGDGVTKVYAIKNYADTPGSTFQNAYTLSFGTTNQAVFAPSQFQTIGPGTLLIALSMRNRNNTAWPAFPTSSNYSIELSRSQNGPDTLSTTVANNTGADSTIVRSGALNVLTGAMAPAPAGETAPFTWEIPFSTPYPYRSGSLLNVVRVSGFTSVGNVDAVALLDPANGVETRGLFSLSAATATTLSEANVPIMRYTADAQVMVPNSIKDGVGLGTGYVAAAPYASTDSTFQFIVGPSQLTYVPIGGLITSMSLLAAGSQAAWPGVTGANADDLQIEISTAANLPQDMSTTFSQNVGADALVVRSGPIAWSPGALPAASTGRFGGTIPFERGFVYKGGPLCITVRHSGVINGGPTLLAANPFQAIRVVRSTSKTATQGDYFAVDSGPAVQLGYIPTAVTPRSALDSDGTSGNRFIFSGNRAYQMLYDADQVAVPIGATINGVSFRIDNGEAASTFPSADLTLDRFDITMSSAIRTAATMSNVFENNEGPDVTTVRSGPLTIPAGSYPGFTPQRPFGLFIPFTRPFVYRGGPITMLLRNGNVTGASPSGGFDSTSAGASGVRNTTDPNAANGASGQGGIIARFAFTDDAFCPADLNNDGIVDDLDFQVFVLAYNILDCTEAGMAFGCPSDFNFDRIVNDDDFLPFVQAYNAVLCP